MTMSPEPLTLIFLPSTTMSPFFFNWMIALPHWIVSSSAMLIKPFFAPLIVKLSAGG